MHIDAHQAALSKSISLSIYDSKFYYSLNFLDWLDERIVSHADMCTCLESHCLTLHCSCIQHAWNNDLSYATWTIDKYANVSYSICYFSILHISECLSFADTTSYSFCWELIFPHPQFQVCYNEYAISSILVCINSWIQIIWWCKIKHQMGHTGISILTILYILLSEGVSYLLQLRINLFLLSFFILYSLLYIWIHV